MKRLHTLFAVVASMAAVSAEAASVTHNFSAPTTSTNFTTGIILPQFDGSLGTLTSVVFDLAGNVFGSFRFESLDTSAATVTGNLSSTITLLNGSSSLIQVIPLADTTDQVSAFDGTTDFGGTSGKTYGGLSGSAANTQTLVGSLMAPFQGSGNLALVVTAVGSSFASGAGNLLTQFATQANYNLNVTYHYTTEVPVPAAVWLLGSALVGVAGVARRRAA